MASVTPAPAVAQARAKLQEFQKQCAAEPCDIVQCKLLLSDLRVLIAQFPSSSPVFQANAVNPEELVVARDSMEAAVFLSIRTQDADMFERQVASLYPYYFDLSKEMPVSPQRLPILGMYLIHLLSTNRAGELHMTLERIPLEDHQNPCIQFAVSLERHLMEGNYHRIIAAKTQIPVQLYAYFVDRLIEAARDMIASCMAKSYRSISVQYAVKSLMLNSVQELQYMADAENAREKEDPSGAEPIHWEIKDDRLFFNLNERNKKEIPAIELVNHMLGYASELERIV